MQFVDSVKVLSFLIFSSMLLGFISQSVQAIGNKLQNNSIPSVIVFGDSIVDTGNNNNLVTIVKANYPPYGRDLIGGKPTGRFSNGKVPSDLIAEELGIKELLPPYLDPNLQNEDLVTGVNFASGGCGLDPLTSELLNVISLTDQLELFKEYLTRLKEIAGDDKTASILSNGLFLVIIGSNDITNNYFGAGLRNPHYDVPSYTDFMLCESSSFIQSLCGIGARKIGVFGLPPLGCMPSQRTLKGGLLRQCVDNYNQMAELFNAKLIAEIKNLNIKYPKARIVYGDIYSIALDLIYNPQKYGFSVGNVGCCGTGTVEVEFLCKYVCSNVSEYVFWDSFHPTEKAYRVLVQDFLKRHLNSFI